jgi:hypothetical protein
MSKHWSWSSLLVCVASSVVLATAGCKSNSGTLSVSTNATPAAATDSDAGPDAGVDAGPGGIKLCDNMLIDHVRVVVRRINLEKSPPPPSDAGMDAGTDAGMAFCECPEDDDKVCVNPNDDVHIGPFLVDVSGNDLTNGIHQVFDSEVPQGSYDEVKFVINTLSERQIFEKDGGLNEALDQMEDLHASIAVNGTFGGNPFQFTTSIRVKQKQQGPFVVGDTTKNIVLVLDPKSWFIGGDGHVLDPNDPTNRGAIKANIRCSVRMSSSETPKDGGPAVRRDFDDDDDEDECRAEDDDQGGHGEGDLMMPSDHGGGSGDDPDEGHRFCGTTPSLVCPPAPDAGTPDAGH